MECARAHKTPVLIESLGLETLVVLTSDGKPIQWVHFKFSDYHDAKLCPFISMATKGCSWAIGLTLYGARRRPNLLEIEIHLGA